MKSIIRRIFRLETLAVIGQVFMWVIIFLLLFTVVTAGFEFGEFRYVAF